MTNLQTAPDTTPSGPPVPDTPKSDASKPAEKKKNSVLDGYALVILGALLFMIGGHFSNSPLAGQHKLLVATSAIGMKELKQTVIFLIGHSRQGTVGIILNHKPDETGVALGGPVGRDNPEKIYALHSLDVVLPGTLVLKDVDLGLLEGTKAIDMLKAARTKPSWYIIVKGFAGWAPGQMEQEITDGGWNLADFDRKTITEVPPGKMWDAARKLSIIQLTH